MSAGSPAILDRFVPQPDAGGRHEITICAPPDFVLEIARNFDIQSIGMVRAIFWLRAKILGAQMPAESKRAGLVSQMLGLGWACLDEERGHFFIAGAACRPWQANVVFSAIPQDQFLTYASPDQVKIAWTLESEGLGPELTRFATETRVAATDDEARAKFRRYWRKFGIGIIMIRRLLLPVIRREAERRWQAAANSGMRRL